MVARRAAPALAVLVLVAALLAAPAPALAVKTLGISSPSFEFNVAAGDSGKGECVVINDGTEPISVLVYTANQTIDSKGQVTYETPKLDGGDLLNSPALWLRLKVPEDTKAVGNTPYLELAPKQRIPVAFTFSVPEGVPPGDHQVIMFFEMVDLEQTANATSSKIGARVGSRIRLRVAGQFEEIIDVRPFVVREFVVGDKVPWTFVVRNDGNLDKGIASDIVVRDSNEADVVTKSAAKDLTVFAGTTLPRSGTLTLPPNALGRYTFRLTTRYVKIGQSQPIEVVKERVIWVVPLWLVIAVVVVAGGFALWLSWRGAVRSAERGAARKAAKEAERRAANALQASASEPGAEEERVAAPAPAPAVPMPPSSTSESQIASPEGRDAEREEGW